MVKVKIECVHCESDEIVKMGYQNNGAPRCKCKNCGKTFQREYTNKGAKPETKRMIIKMSTNGNGIRETARVLGVSKDTVRSVVNS